MVADAPGTLVENHYLLQNLSSPCALSDTSWIKPGKVWRSSLTTRGAKAIIDYAAANNYQYVHYDAGWYGPERDAKSDPLTVIDDIDMNITHVVRGDDHVNNTPRQINIYRALEAELPQFAHLPMILGADGERLSKRHGAVSVMQYPEDGYLPEALLNYLARLGWSHGDEEKFSLQQMVEWFDLAHVSGSPARFDPQKLAWLNQQYLKEADDQRLADLTMPFLERDGCRVAGGPELHRVVALLKARVNTVEELADAAVYFYRRLEPSAALRTEHYAAAVKPALTEFRKRLETVEWQRDAIGAVLKAVLADYQLKMPKMAMPLRVMVTGEPQSPSIDATLELIGRDEVLARMAQVLAAFPD